MKKKLLLLALIIINCKTLLLFAQAPAIEWQKCLGGMNSDEAQSAIQTSDGGYAVTGRSRSIDGDVTGNHAGYDYWVVKLTNMGIIEWQKSLGGTLADNAYQIQQTTDGGYIVAGNSISVNGDVTGGSFSGNYWVVKLNSLGTIEWNKSLGGTSADYAYSIIQTTDGGYVVAGSSLSNDGDVTGNHGNKDFWVVKLNSAGTLVWQKSLGGAAADIAYSIERTTDGGYIVAGSSGSSTGDATFNHGGLDYWVVKLDNSGAIVWQKSLGGVLDDVAYSVRQTSDGGYIVAGSSLSNDGDVTGNHGFEDYWLVKLNNAGTLVWQHSYGGTDGIDIATTVRQTSEGGYVIAGYSSSSDGDVVTTHNIGGYEYWIVKTDNLGTIQWQKCFGGNADDYGHSIEQTNDGGYILSGYTDSNDGDVSGYQAVDDYWVIKLASDPLGITTPEATTFSISPNPTISSITIQNNNYFPSNTQIVLSDMLGREVANIINTGGTKMIKINIDQYNITDGLLVVKLMYNGQVSVAKVMYHKE